LDEVSYTDAGLRGNVCKVAAEAFKTAVLALGALIGENEGAIARSGEAVVE
jgi:hypothetical protein